MIMKSRKYWLQSTELLSRLVTLDLIYEKQITIFINWNHCDKSSWDQLSSSWNQQCAGVQFHSGFHSLVMCLGTQKTGVRGWRFWSVQFSTNKSEWWLTLSELYLNICLNYHIFSFPLIANWKINRIYVWKQLYVARITEDMKTLHVFFCCFFWLRNDVWPSHQWIFLTYLKYRLVESQKDRY